MFNVRLGSWFQNPRRPEIWRQPGPAHALRPLLSELFGLSNDRSDFVYLSDGGHFENLGDLGRIQVFLVTQCDNQARLFGEGGDHPPQCIPHERIRPIEDGDRFRRFIYTHRLYLVFPRIIDTPMTGYLAQPELQMRG